MQLDILDHLLKKHSRIFNAKKKLFAVDHHQKLDGVKLDQKLEKVFMKNKRFLWKEALEQSFQERFSIHFSIIWSSATISR
jgi:hypothetical protein